MPRTFEEPLGGIRKAGKPEISAGMTIQPAKKKGKFIPPSTDKAKIVPLPLWTKDRQVHPAPNPEHVRLGMLRRDI